MEPVLHNSVVTGVKFGGAKASPLTPDIELGIWDVWYPLTFNMAAHKYLLGMARINLIADTNIDTVSDPDNLPHILYAMAVASRNIKNNTPPDLTIEQIHEWLDTGLANMDEAVTAIMFVIMKTRSPEELVKKAQSLAPLQDDEAGGPDLAAPADPTQ